MRGRLFRRRGAAVAGPANCFWKAAVIGRQECLPARARQEENCGALPLSACRVGDPRLCFCSLNRPVSEEIFDVVNQQDEVVDRQPRSEVHRLGLMHRATHVLVFNARGQVFLQKRSMQKDRQPGLWDSSASGHLNCGEDYDACAKRELYEEIGLELGAPPQRLFKLCASPETDQEHVWIYRCAAEGPFTLHPEEIESGGWFSPEEIALWMAERPQEFASALVLIWRELRKRRMVP
jgi:isopentenyldiphosphate isomerase